jgi:sortase (surface protein transpeptidase)
MEPLRQWWTGQARQTRVAVIGGAAALVVLAVLGASLLIGGGSDDPAVSIAPSNTSTVDPSAPGPTHTAEPLPTEDPDLPTLEALREFVKEAGDPPNANIGRFKIPRIGVDAPIGERVVGSDLSLQFLNPYGPADVSWYNFDVDPRYGGDIGEGDNAIFAAHVDYAALVPFAQINYRGPGVFRDINLLNPGDLIEITMHGKTVRYKVAWKRQVTEAEGDWATLFSADVPEGNAITLVTCSGDFNTVTREYDSRTVIRGEEVKE